MRIAEEYSGELSVDTRSSGCQDVVHTCRGRDSRHSGRRADQRPGRAVVTVIHRPTRLVANVERGPARCRLRPDHRMHLLTPSQHHRIALRGPLCCVAQGQPQPSEDPPGLLRRGADSEAGFGQCHHDFPRSRQLGDVVLGWMMASGDGAQVLRLLIGQVWRLARMRPRRPDLNAQLLDDLPAGGRHQSTGPELPVRHHSLPDSHCGNEMIIEDSSCGLEPIT